jgi:hypothetical protein
MGFLDNFEKSLNDFFFAKHPRQIKKIPEIMKEFKGRERDVMLHLCKKYKVNPDTIDGLSDSVAPAAVVEEVAVEMLEPTIEETEASAEVNEDDSENENTEETKEEK